MEQGTQGGPPGQPTYDDSEFAAYSRYTDEQLRLVMNTPGINGLTLAERLAAESAPGWPERLADALDQLDAFNAMINQERPGE